MFIFSSLYAQLIHFPTETKPIMDGVASEEYKELCNLDINPFSTSTKHYSVQVRIYNLSSLSRIRDLGPSDIDKLVCIRGIVIRNSEIIPEMRDNEERL